jgi:glucose-6-phosphate isomerase
MTWPPELLLVHPRRPWSADATRMGLGPEALDGLPWGRAFDEMEALEAGDIANPDEERQVGHYWLRAPERAPTIGQARAIGETAEAVRAFAAKVRSGAVRAPDGEPFTDVLHVGIGGSALGPALLVDALDPGSDGLRVHFLDNTDPDGIARTLLRLGERLHHTLVLVVSKSGGTVETRNGMELATMACEARGLNVPGRMVAITGDGSRLHQRATREGWLTTFPLWDWVGGRTSVTSAVGLLPAELAGIDTLALLSGARDMDEWTRIQQWRENPAALLAGCWHAAGGGRGDRSMVVLPYADRLLLLSRYLQQLVMESLGKRLDRAGRVVDQGIAVYGNKGSTDQHAYVQQLRDGRDDFFVTFIQVLTDGAGGPDEIEPGTTAGDFLQGFLLGTRRALAERERPSITLTVPQVDPYVLGGLIALFERAVGLYASLVDINAYHQPGVEAGKKAAGSIVDLSRDLRAALRDGSADVPTLAKRLTADPLEVYYVLEHLTATRRAVREGDIPDARWRLPRGSER